MAAKKPARPTKKAAKKPAADVAVAKPAVAVSPVAVVPVVDHAARVAESWRRLEVWVAAFGGPPLALNSGAAEKSIAAAEKTMKLAFPPDFRASLLQHDGQATSASADQRSFPWMPGCPPLAPLARIVERWQEEQDLAGKKPPRPDPLDGIGKLKVGLHRSGRIPIAGSPRWDSGRTLLDLDPGRAGVGGQLLTMVNKADFVVIDVSFAAALERWVAVLERGLWSYDRDTHAVHPRALAPSASHPAGLFSKR